MAETALGMATTLVGSALAVVSSAAREEMGLLLGVQDDIWFINDELTMIQAFLRAADGALENTGVLKAYLDLIRDLAYDIEDCLEEFMVFIKNKNLVQQLLHLRARHRIAVQICTLKQRVQETSQRNKRYNLIRLTPSISNDVTGDTEMTRNLTALYVEEAQLIGLDEPRKKLLELVTKQKAPMEPETSTRGPGVVSIVGMGGLGKTTLAKKVYDSKDLGDMFGTRAWITVSQSFSPHEILKDMIKQLFGGDSLKKFLEGFQGQVLTVQHLTGYLCRALQERRYFIVLDDVWTIEAWNRIKLTFPENSKGGSCVVVTTRNGNLAELCSPPSHIHQLEFLKKEDARILFQKKINRSVDDLGKGSPMKEIVDKILNKCGGLPLAIVTIGSLLANKNTKEWEKLYNQLPSELSSNPSLEALRRVVNLSYNHMPSHLKPCFLHLSIFPEDFEIKRKHLVNRWIAEGFVANDTTKRTLEDVAESYFYELISRSMIQPSELDILGNVRTCRVHDIVHDIAVSISREENHVFLVEEHTSTTTATKQSIRHLSCFAQKKLSTGLALSGVRSFTLFSETMVPLTSFRLSRFKMLRVLDLRYAVSASENRVGKQDIDLIGSLIHLKYLHFPLNSDVYALPRSIVDLRGLQTLDMRQSHFTSLPTEITKLQSLRNLRCSNMGPTCSCFDIHDYIECFTTAAFPTSYLHDGGEFVCCCCFGTDRSRGVRVPKGMGRLQELQVLERVDIRRSSGKAINDLGELTQLKKLVVAGEGASKKKCKIFSVALEKLSSLRSLRLSAEYADGSEMMSRLISISSPLPLLESLTLKGYLGKIPSWVGQSVNLAKMELTGCCIMEVEALAELPNLMLLRLWSGAYNAEKLVFRIHAFPNLKGLLIHGSRTLRELTFEERASPHLESIVIIACRLTSGINGIKHLENLKEISIQAGALAKVDMLREEVDTHPNHPVLRMSTEEHDVTVEAVESPSEPGESSQS